MPHPYGSLLAAVRGALLLCAAVGPLDAQQTVALRLSAGRPVEVASRITGRDFVDYSLRGAAGQTLVAHLRTASRFLYFNVLPPESESAAMFVGAMTGDSAVLRLPDDGLYRIRVYLVRAAARRGQRAEFTLRVLLRGTALPPRASTQDATLPGTRFHASASIECTHPGGTGARCEAFVVRRGQDGSATVLIRWHNGVTRRLLFERGVVVAGDAWDAPVGVRSADETVVTIAPDERYLIPDAFIRGG